MNTPKVIDLVVNNDLCIGCGLCVYACPSQALDMKWNDYGFLVPELTGTCELDGACLDVCPFNPIPLKEVETEFELADLFLNDTQKKHPKIGKYSAIYAGYADEFRLSSSSGGMGTYIFTELLVNGIVDYVFSVKESEKAGVHYEYSISRSKEELLKASKTRYFPVTLDRVLSEIQSLDGKVAIVGVACFIKAIRLAQYREPQLKDKIPFLVGIICGGVKSRFFTEYLSSKVDVEKQNIEHPNFRIKDYESTASDYSYGCKDKATDEEKTIKMRSVGDMWGTGLFKANACDFCDDVTTELADISLGDAWLHPYVRDGKGTNVVVTRSEIADELIQNGIKKGDLTLENLSLEAFLASQQGSFNHRHTGLSVRIKEAKKRNQPVPPKRFGNEKVTMYFKIVQKLRMKVRRKSLVVWKKNSNAKPFDSEMKSFLNPLKVITKVNHLRRRLGRLVMKLKGNKG
ncbi:Coenzyme F420 hydrogenase/dehydrogenase, beta subunit C-terminal domain [Gelidibacter japonicus]|uniref:Coenzyme F420 hydrogenase/dehydrogenase, beta subunit C-terminal domain n=1 Tax=Gelidibacter japonicus TaxID=1962232 RepID=UPI003A953A23